MMYRRKTYDVDAMQWDGKWAGEHGDDVPAAVIKWAGKWSVFIRDHQFGGLGINTPDGAREARPGDWLLKGVDGEITAVTPEYFEATFDPIIRPSSLILPGLGARMN